MEPEKPSPERLESGLTGLFNIRSPIRSAHDPVRRVRSTSHHMGVSPTSVQPASFTSHESTTFVMALLTAGNVKHSHTVSNGSFSSEDNSAGS